VPSSLSSRKDWLAHCSRPATIVPPPGSTKAPVRVRVKVIEAVEEADMMVIAEEKAGPA
jgi:hypothetical protein